MHLTSSVFDDGGAIPTRHSCDGADVSPPLAIEAIPGGTAALAPSSRAIRLRDGSGSTMRAGPAP